MRKWCRENLVVSNPEFYKKQSLGKWTGGTPEYIYLFEEDGGDLIIPFGCFEDFYFRYRNVCDFKPHFSPIRHTSYEGEINLYSYQEKAVNEALKKRNGVMVMPCGSGKTQSALALIQRLGGKALWLTHTADLLNQSLKRAESLMQADYGTITGGKVNIGEGITFATIQTMVNLDLAQYRDCWDIVVVDECHKAVGSPTKVMQFYKVVSNLNARYKYGLTATPRRSDGLERSMFTLLGGIIHEVTRQEVAHTTCPIKVKQVYTNWMPDYDCVLMGDGTIDYNKVVEQMTESQERFEAVMQTLQGLQKGDRLMVLANRVDYLNRLCEAFNQRSLGDAICISGTPNNKYGKAERKRALQALEAGEINCIFATYQLAKEGLDVPNLRYVIFATPEKDPTTIEQSTGRVGRKADGKSYGTVIDFVDDFGMYKGWWKKRLSVYKKIGCDIIE